MRIKQDPLYVWNNYTIRQLELFIDIIHNQDKAMEKEMNKSGPYVNMDDFM